MHRSVTFTYLTGLQSGIFSNARLAGSWDEGGGYSNRWAKSSMVEFTAEDGCQAFRAAVKLDPGAAGTLFRWGVILDGPGGPDLWAIPLETMLPGQSEQTREFFLTTKEGEAEQIYRLHWSRTCGAQKYFHQDERVGLRFCVWAPNAESVSVCIANVWAYDEGPQNGSLLKATRNPAMRPRKRESIAGGYVADNAKPGTSGLHPEWAEIPMTRDELGFWWTDPAEPELQDFKKLDHVPYIFRVTKEGGFMAYRTDLYSRCQIGGGEYNPRGAAYEGLTSRLDGSVSCSVVVDPDRVTRHWSEPEWPEQEWVTQEEFFASPAPHPDIGQLKLADLIIYELHVGALGAGLRAPDEPGTLADALALLDHLQELGVNAVELLPLSEFGGGGAGWGYATSHYCALEYAGGGRDHYKWFIRECHRRAIAVIIDVVYNHYSHDAERAEWMFDTDSHVKNPYYWYEGEPGDYKDFDAMVEAHRKGTGGYVDNNSSGWAPRYWEEPVRALFLSSAIAQVAEFKIDGFRVDQTTSIRWR